MEQNIDQTQLLQSLYQEYLTRTIQLTQENLKLQLKVAELKAAGNENASEAA
ncbi:MAG: hypothetical protein ACTIC1_05635 [Brevibacterium sp.]|uniref:hypothetical protein n=1 Tax=Brevibacterium aurantiacum TaxID=273384 RepID=UPI003F921445